MASRCMTCTTDEGKYVRMSPSQRATDGADAQPRRTVPPCPPLAVLPVQRGERPVHRRVLPRERASGAVRLLTSQHEPPPPQPLVGVGGSGRTVRSGRFHRCRCHRVTPAKSSS